MNDETRRISFNTWGPRVVSSIVNQILQGHVLLNGHCPQPDLAIAGTNLPLCDKAEKGERQALVAETNPSCLLELIGEGRVFHCMCCVSDDVNDLCGRWQLAVEEQATAIQKAIVGVEGKSVNIDFIIS